MANNKYQIDAIDALKFIMKEKGHNVSVAARVMGLSKSHLAEVVSRSRKTYSYNQAKAFYKYGVPAHLLLKQNNEE